MKQRRCPRPRVPSWVLCTFTSGWLGCASEASPPRMDPVLPAPAIRSVRAAGDSADLETWTVRRDEAATRLTASAVPADQIEVARCTRNRALALAGGTERAAELARADALARDAMRRAPADRAARYWVARIALDRFNEGRTGSEGLVNARRILASLVADERSFGGGAALAALAEAYALAGRGRPEAPELERAAAFFEATLDVAPGYRPALLGYAEGVLAPWGDSRAAARLLVACATLPLQHPAGDGQRFVDDDRAQRRCAERLGIANDSLVDGSAR